MNSTALSSTRLPDVQGCCRWRSRSWSTASVAAAQPAVPSTCSTSSATIQQPRLITHHISNSRNLAELSVICLEQQQLNPIHISAVLSACVRHTRRASSSHVEDRGGHALPQAMQQQRRQQLHAATATDHLQLQMLVSEVLVRLQGQQHLCRGREIANILWCLAALQLSPPPGVVQQLVARFGDVSHASTCQAHSMVLYSLAVLGHKPEAPLLDQLLYSMVKTSRTAAAGSSESQQQQQCRDVQHKEQQQPCSSTQAFANAIWALERLQQPETAFIWLLPLLSLLHSSIVVSEFQQQQQQLQEAATAETTPQLAAVHAQASSQARVVWTLATSLWASVMLLESHQRNSTPAVSTTFAWPQTGSKGATVSPVHSRLLPALQLLAGKLLECSTTCLCRASPSEIAALLWACLRLQVKPSTSWAQAMFVATGQQLGSCGARECVSLLRGVARLRLLPPHSWLVGLFSATRQQLGSLTAEQLASLVWSCGTLRIRPPVDWMGAVVRSFAAQLGSSNQPTPAFISMMVWGASKLGYQLPGPAAAVITRAVQASAAEYGPHQTSKLLLGCSMLQWKLQPELESALLQTLTQQLDRASPADITMTIRALANPRAAVARARQEAFQRQQQQQLQRDWNSTQLQSALQPVRVPPWEQYLHGAEAGHAAPWLWAAGRLPSAAAAATTVRARPSTPTQQLQLLQQQWVTADMAQGQQVQKLFDRAEQLLGAMTPAELCQCLYSAVYLGPQLSWQWSQALNHVLPDRMQQLGPGDLCLLLWSLPRLQCQVQVKRLLHKQLLAHSQCLLLSGRFTPRDLSMFMWHYQSAFRSSRQGLPRSWLVVFCRAAQSQLRNFTVKQLGVMLRACVLLDVVLEPQLLQHAGLMLELWSAKLDRGERAMIVASLLQLQQRSMQAATSRVQSNAVRFWPTHPQQPHPQQRVVWVQAPRTRYYIHAWDGHGGVITAGHTSAAQQQQQEQQKAHNVVLTVLR